MYNTQQQSRCRSESSMQQHAVPGTAGSSPPSVLTTLHSCESGLRRLSGKHTAYLQQTYINKQLQNLKLKPLADAKQTVDKAFCSVWLDSETVLVGTKCNSLLMLQPRRGSHSLLQYPQQQQQQQRGSRQHQELQSVPAAISCGQHAVALSPDGQWLATGGQAPNDILLWHLSRQQQQQQQQHSDLQVQAAAACRSSTVAQPVQVLTGHADWVFGMAWLDESRFVSAGRDKLLKLWQLPQNAAAAAAAAAGRSCMQFSDEPGVALSTVRYHSDKVRCIKYDRQQQAAVTACMDGVVAWWTPEMQLAGAVKLPGECPEPQSLLLQGSLVVVGTQRAALLLDSRVAHTPVASVAVGEAPLRKRRRVEMPAAAAAAAAAAESAGGGEASADTDGLSAVGAWQPTRQWQQRQDHHQQQQQQQHRRQQQDDVTDDDASSGSYSESDDELSADAEDAASGVADQAAITEGHGQQQQQQQQQGGDPGAMQRQLAGQLLASLHGSDVAQQQRLLQQLPGHVAYAFQRFAEQEARSRRARAGRPGMSSAEQQLNGQQSSRRLPYAVGPQDRLAAHLTGSICMTSGSSLGANGVRSLSLHHHLLGLGCCGGQLLMHDMRKLSSTAAAAAAAGLNSSRAAEQLQQYTPASGNAGSCIPPYNNSWVNGSAGDLPARVGCLSLPELACRQPAAAAAAGDAWAGADAFWAPALSGGGRAVYRTPELAVFTHAWDPSGTQLFMGGGPVVLVGQGCSLALCC